MTKDKGVGGIELLADSPKGHSKRKSSLGRRWVQLESRGDHQKEKRFGWPRISELKSLSWRWTHFKGMARANHHLGGSKDNHRIDETNRRRRSPVPRFNIMKAKGYSSTASPVQDVFCIYVPNLIITDQVYEQEADKEMEVYIPMHYFKKSIAVSSLGIWQVEENGIPSWDSKASREWGNSGRSICCPANLTIHSTHMNLYAADIKWRNTRRWRQPRRSWRTRTGF